MMRILHSLAVTLLSAPALAMPGPVIAQTVVPLAPFGSVELRDCGKVILHHGPVQRVTLLKGSPDYTQVTIAGGDRLVIDKCRNKCPRGYELEIEIVTPDIAGISSAEGGTIESRGNFPRQAEIKVAVSNGGRIDIRSMTVDSVTASVDQGGRIFTKPQSTMIASVRQGGSITYWGDAEVISSVQHGGVVTKGTAAEADKPLSDFGPSLPSVPPSPIPPLSPIQAVRNLFR
jgi:hypothetical protein